MNGEITVFFRQKIIGKFVTAAYHVSKNILWRFFLKKKLFFIIGHWATLVCHFDENLSVPMSVLLSVCQLDQFVVKKVSSNFFLHKLQTLIANWSVFVRFFSAKLTTLPFTSPRYQFDEGKTFCQIFVCFIYHLRTLSQKIEAFFRKTFGRVVKIDHHVSRGIFCREFFFEKFSFFIWSLGIERLLSVISTKINRSLCQYCFLFVN